MRSLKVYGNPASQPSRAVIWAWAIKALPIELITDPSVIDTVNPRGQLPAIDHNGFVLSEMPAILSYLGSMYGWADLYPEEIHARARISQYLHAHHNLTRLATLKLMAPHVLVAFGEVPTANPLSYLGNTCIETSMADNNKLASGKDLVTHVVDFLQRSYLKSDDFIAGTATASIADLACYEEIGQLEAAGLFEFSAFAEMRAWLQRMQSLPYHDDLHLYNKALGDIQSQPNSMDRFMNAIGQAITALGALDNITLA